MHSLHIRAKTLTTKLARIVSSISSRTLTDDFPGTTVTGSVFSSAVEQDTELQSLPKGTPTSNLFGVLLSDVLFTILPGEYHRVRHYLLTQLNLSHDFIGSIKRSFWRRNCKYSCGESKTTLHVRLNMWDWSWNTRALQVSGEIPNVVHPCLLVVDQLVDVCTGSDMFPDGSEVPVTLCK